MTRTEIRIPRQGIEDSVEEVTISRWLVQDKTIVTKGQAICEVETGKSLLEVESPISGTIEIIWHDFSKHIQAKELTADGSFLTAVIAVIKTDKKKTKVSREAQEQILLLAKDRGLTSGGIFTEITKAGDIKEITTEMVMAYGANLGTYATETKAIYAARTLATQNGIDLSLVQGTGPEHVITVADVQKYICEHEQPVANIPVLVDSEFEPASGVRQAIAQNLTLGYAIPTAASKGFMFGMEELFTFKKRHGKRFQELYGVPYTITFPIASAIVRVLKKPLFRKLNAHTISVVRELIPGFPCLIYTGIICRRDINLGISFNNESANGESNLKIAVAKALQDKSLKEIALALHNAMTGAEKGKMEFLSDWTFILNNVGGIGDYEGHSILTAEVTPEHTIKAVTAELNMGAIDRETGKATMQLFFDHRPFDGKLANAFRNTVCHELIDTVLQELAESLY